MVKEAIFFFYNLQNNLKVLLQYVLLIHLSINFQLSGDIVQRTLGLKNVTK